MNVLSLFSGIGGIELGLERAGMTTVGQVEIDPWCRDVLAKHWPDVPQHEDVTTAPAWWLSQPRPAVHVVCGGFPCQPFSLGGKQKGMNDERWMWPAFEAVIRTVRPRYVLVENVSALVRDGRAWGTVLADLHTLGFDAEWATLHASDFGAPTPRERVYLVAYPAGIDGQPRDRMGESRIGRTPLAARGLSGLDAHSQRRAAREWLDREPRVDRLANGIPRQVDRLRGIGNAVVPAAAERIGRLMIEHELAVSS
ncbi:DNA cytosine methyltransferase [Microbacterium sp. W4I20]|uniref:DNA cytosine methyltransferase n=1 Tax=Microbacterium sp. W4I20 TaxID=3042262 RepID=UPI00358FE0BA